MNIVDSAAVNSFADHARGFCNWCESLTPDTQQASQAASWLCKLYAAALELPQVESENSDGLPNLPPLQLEQAKNSLSPFNGFFYREYFNPDPLINEESCLGDIGDDLLDIYKDIRSGLLLFEQGKTAEAVWFWAFLHHVHWGRHAVGAIFALHCLLIANQE